MRAVPDGRPILVIDDAEVDRAIIRRVLKRSNLRNDIVSVDGGPAALDYIRGAAADVERMPALALLDVNMPGMSGFEVLAELKADEGLRGAFPVAMLTSSDSVIDQQAAADLGADGYIIKQAGITEFVDAINEAFEND